MKQTCWIVGLALFVGGCYSGVSPSADSDAAGTSETDGADTDAADSTGADDDDSGSTGGDTSVDEDCVAGPHVGDDHLVRLTLHQYDATVRDLVGIDAGVARTSFSADVRLGNSVETAFTEGAPVSPLVATQLLLGAETIAEMVDPSALTACDGGDACVDAFVGDFGRRGFRRPLSDDEHAILRGIYNAESSHDDGVRAVVQAVLQSPAFLYLLLPDTRDAAPGDVVALDDWSLASRLSYFVWGTMPDETLFEAAEAGMLHDDAGLRAELQRMLSDPRAEAGVREFYDAVIDLDFVGTITKDANTYPEFNTDIAADLQTSLWMGLRALHLDGDGTLGDLITGVPMYANERLATYYGLPAVSGEAFEPVAERGGVLAHPAMAALIAKPDDTAIVHRGLFVWDALLCNPLDPPPEGVEPELPEGGDWDTPRERLAQHREDPACAGCHDLVDPIGYAMEHLGGDGRYRDAWPSGVTVDASGEILLGSGVQAFEDLGGLEQALADDALYQSCMTRHWLTFATRRVPGEFDACTQDDIVAQTMAEGGSLDQLMESIVLSDGFRYVRASE